MQLRRSVTFACGLVVLLTMSTAARAAMFDFTTGAMGSGFGNSIEVTNDGVTATLTGWGLATSSGSTFQTSQVIRWSTGVGSCNQTEGLNCGNGPHTVGNNAGLDVLFVRFTSPVFLTSAVITAWANDFDASFWGGTGAFSLLGKTLSDLTAVADQHNSGFSGSVNVGSTTRSVNLSVIETEVDWLAFGARTGQSNDKFKFRELAVTPSTNTPEPGVLFLLGAGILGFSASARRRKSSR